MRALVSPKNSMQATYQAHSLSNSKAAGPQKLAHQPKHFPASASSTMAQLPPDLDPTIRAQAWIGDAILALYVREWILRMRNGAIDGQLFIEFTSNQFLRLKGNATAMEAQIGRIFKSEGREAAYAWIDQELRPLMDEKLHIMRRKGLA